MYDALRDRFALLVLAKSVLTAGVLFPPAFFMGGTLPFIAQHLVRRRDELGRRGALVYGVNTAGAAAAGFYLPLALGFRGTYVLDISGSFLGLPLLTGTR